MKKAKVKAAIEEAKNAAGMCSELTVSGRREVMAHGCRAILSYSESEVKLRLQDMVLTVAGAGLTMKSYYDGSVRVSGRLTGLRFES